MKVAGLFAGIGGLETGLGTGFETTLLSEILPAARAVLAAHMPGVEINEDVRTLKALPADIDVVTAGFPCQDLSQAGLAKGLDGDRSGLVGEVFRLIQERSPRWLVLENVPFMLQLGGGEAMRRIVAELDKLGFRWAWRVVDSYSFGLPQRRERVILIASRTEDPAKVLFADDAPLARPATAVGHIAHGFYWTEGRGGLGWAADAIPTLKNGSAVGIPSPPAILLPDGRIVKPDIRDAERLQGFPSGWTAPAETVGRASARWGLIGSAVSVPVARWIGSRLARPGDYDLSRNREFSQNGRLPRAARGSAAERFAVEIGTDPLGVRPISLASFLRHEGDLLSARATAGFLGRTRRAKLRFAPGFIAAVEAHLRSMTGDQSEEKRVA